MASRYSVFLSFLLCALVAPNLLLAEEKGRASQGSNPIIDVFTQPVPGQTGLGPTWLDELTGEAPKRGPGRTRVRIDAPLDVLYLRGGSVLRGYLIKEDFPNHYALASREGTVYVVDEASIEARTKEPALVEDRANRSHRGQIGVIFAPTYSGGLSVDVSALGGGSSPSVSAVPFTGQLRASLSFALSPALELAAGINTYTVPVGDGSRKRYWKPLVGLRYYSNVHDPVKFYRGVYGHFGFQDAFSILLVIDAGFQFDVARNVGLFIGAGPEVQVIPNIIIGFGLGGGVQARFP